MPAESNFAILPAVNEKSKAHLALLGANLFYGAGFTVAKMVMPRLIQPTGFILIRVGVVLCLFWLSYFIGPAFRTKIEKRDWPVLIAGGLFGVALNQLLFFLGLNLTLPIHASLIMMSTPLLITLIAAIVLKEQLRGDKVVGLIVGVSGAILLMSAGKQITSTGQTAKGDLLVLLNAASYAIYLVMIRPLMKRYRPIIVIRWVFLFGFLFVLPFGWSSFNAVDWALFQPGDFAAILFIVVGCTFFTYLWNVYALRILSSSVAGAYIYLQPLFAAIIAVLFAGEEFTLIKLLSAMLIFTGVYLVNFGWSGKRK